MAKLRVPTLQHLSRNWFEEPLKVQKALVGLAVNSPTFNYDPLFHAVRDHWVLGQSIEEIATGLQRGVKREFVLNNYLSILPHLAEALSHTSPSFVQDVSARHYRISQELVIPFRPQFVYGVGGKLYLPWFSFWKANPLTDLQLSLFVSIIRDIVDQDPDLEDAIIQIFDFSAPASKSERNLRMITEAEVNRLNLEQIERMLAIFADGFQLAQAHLENQSSATSKAVSDEVEWEHPILPGIVPIKP